MARVTTRVPYNVQHEHINMNIKIQYVFLYSSNSIWFSSTTNIFYINSQLIPTILLIISLIHNHTVPMQAIKKKNNHII